MYKKLRYADRIATADAEVRLRDIHLLIGGTGAVGGEALIKMLRVYADVARHDRSGREVRGPVLVATGRDSDGSGRPLNELRRFQTRLWTLAEAEFGASPTRSGDTIILPTGARVVLRDFAFTVLSPLAEAIRGDAGGLARYLDGLQRDGRPLAEALLDEVRREAPLTDLLRSVREEIEPLWPFERFRSVQIGIPIPSLLAYHLDHVRLLRERGLIGAGDVAGIEEALRGRIQQELAGVRDRSDVVIVAHTTAVGGMYDVGQDGPRRIRLGFAHAALDAFLVDKHRHARTFARTYSEADVCVLITAAAIGIDQVQINRPLEMAREMRRTLERAPREPFPGARDARHVHVHRAATVPLLPDGEGEPLSFDRMPRGGELRPRLALRSGENGYLSVANAEALYRVMRVASPSELGAVLAVVGALGDDPVAPWFTVGEDGRGRECYYKEGDNSRLVFDFLSQPQVRAVQLSGTEPQALVDLGSAKHQGELHALGLLILLHRLRHLDLDAIPAIVEPERFDPVAFFESHSRPLSFEDVQGWSLADLERDLRILVTAEIPDDLASLRRLRVRDLDRLAPNRAAARDLLLEAVLGAVRAVTSLGSPIVVEGAGGEPIVRCGWWVAPLSLLAESTDSIASWFVRRRAELAAAGPQIDLRDLVDHHLAVNGFIDLRAHAIVAASTADEGAAGQVWRTTSEQEMRAILGQLTPYRFFASCGLLALIERLKGLADYLQRAQMNLGTHFDSSWAMPRDERGHTLVVPGIVEAFRMVSEGLEKGTGTEILDGYWGYYPTQR